MAVPSELHWANKPLVFKGSGFGPQMLDLNPGCGQNTYPVSRWPANLYISQGLFSFYSIVVIDIVSSLLFLFLKQ